MEFWKSLSGMLTVEITSAVPEQSLDAVTQAKIPLVRVRKIGELTYQFLIRRRDYRQLAAILQRRGDRLKILQTMGIYWKLKTLLRRPVLLGIFLVLFLSAFYLPSRIYFVTVEGSTTVPDRFILAAAEESGIRFGASRKLVRSEKVKNTLLSSVPQLQWAGVNTSGCTAVISVRERVSEVDPSETNIVSNLVAGCDGHILSTTVTGGTAQVQPGDTVTKGQLLVSGYLDCGICIRAGRAEGEILAQTSRRISAVMPQRIGLIRKITDQKYDISLLVGKKRINLWKDSSISDVGCGRMYQEYYLSLPGEFQLPLAICISRYLEYDIQETQVPENNARTGLDRFSDDYLLRHMVAGQIIQKQQHISLTDSVFRMESQYICTEMIGREQREQIGVINGKRN